MQLVDGLTEGSTPIADFDPLEKVQDDPKLVRGSLENGLRYLLLPCAQPPNRVEAHMVVNCGSLDETDEEQGLAHLVEHVVFCATAALPTSEKVKAAMASIGMSFGADVNASTDFRATKYTFRGPIQRPENFPVLDAGGISDGFEGVLQILREICFRATIQEENVNTERAAVLSELQMRNTIDFRASKAFLEAVHGETRLPKRFPIGLEQSVKNFTAADVQQFYDKFYTPGNMVLVCVGSFMAQDARELVEKVFGGEPKRESPPRTQLLEDQHVFERIDPERRFTCFQHNLLTQVNVCFAVKTRSQKSLTFADLEVDFVDLICRFVFDERIDYIYQSTDDPVVTDVGWGFDMNYREGCSLNSLMMSCETSNLKAALELTIREALRLARHGVLEGEFQRAVFAFRKALKQALEQSETTQSSTHIGELVEAMELQLPFVGRAHHLELFNRAVKVINVDIVNRRLKSLFTGLGIEEPKALPESPGKWDVPVGCGDCFIFISGPTGKTFTAAEFEAIRNSVLASEISARKEIELPDTLVDNPPSRAEFVPVVGAEKKGLDVSDPLRPVESESGMWFRTLSNGIRGAFHVTDNEAKQFDLRLSISSGLRATADEREAAELTVGMYSLLSGGAAGLPSHVVSKYIMSHGIDVEAGVFFDNVAVSASGGVADDGLRRVFELFYALLVDPNWDESAFERTRRERVLAYEDLLLDVDQRTYETATLNFFNGDLRFGTPRKQTLKKIRTSKAKEMIRRLLVPERMELVIVGDFDPEVAESHFASFLGALPTPAVPSPPNTSGPPMGRMSKAIERVSLFDSEERAIIVFMAPMPAKWCIPGASDSHAVKEKLAKQDQPLDEIKKRMRKSPIFGARCLRVLCEIINSRLYKEIREEKKLAYWVSFGLSLMDDGSYFAVRMSPLADRVDAGIAAVLETLQAIAAGEITEHEFGMALAPLVALCESNCKRNAYWIHICSSLTDPTCPKDVSCVTDIRDSYRAITLDDVVEYACCHLENPTISITVGETRRYRTIGDYLPSSPALVRDTTLTTAALVAASVTAICSCVAYFSLRAARSRA